jgi:dienelactone hydrolase
MFSPRMFPRSALCFLALSVFGTPLAVFAEVADRPLPFGAPSRPLQPAADRSADMVRDLHRFFDAWTQKTVALRAREWKRDLSGVEAHRLSVEPQRKALRQMLGAIDPLPERTDLQLLASPDVSSLIARSAAGEVHAVRWTAFAGVSGEGLLLIPTVKAVRARVVVIPDADQSPESLAGLDARLAPQAQVARRLLASGCEVLIVTLLNRDSTHSGVPEIALTDQSHREWAWRPLFEAGRSLIGVEVRKAEAALAWFRQRSDPATKVGVVGYGEGGLIALHVAALNPEHHASLVSGYLSRRESLWSEPIDRNVHGLLRTFGDAELATLALPGQLIIEPSSGPAWATPAGPAAGRRRSAAPGRLTPISPSDTAGEFARALELLTPPQGRPLPGLELAVATGSDVAGFGGSDALVRFLAALGIEAEGNRNAPWQSVRLPDADARQQRQLFELLAHADYLERRSEHERTRLNQRPAGTTASTWHAASDSLRERFWNEHVGRLPDPSLPPNPRSRFLGQGRGYGMWEVTLDVWPGVFAWGTLLVPDGIALGERRPVVVCQHGLEGLPSVALEDDVTTRDWRVYRAFPRTLAERGFICWVPHNPYRGATEFRQLQRRANPIGLTLFSVIVGQHQQHLHWLSSLPFVDPERIGFYGISYGGLSALRLPALLPQYAVSVCSGAFNTWSWKIMTRDFKGSYVFTHEYEHFSFNLAPTFGNADLAALIAPRPFMVERGHQDPVSIDEKVAQEYAKVARLYSDLGIPERTEIEYFVGPHEIHGVGTVTFLHRHLRWPESANPRSP